MLSGQASLPAAAWYITSYQTSFSSARALLLRHLWPSARRGPALIIAKTNDDVHVLSSSFSLPNCFNGEKKNACHLRHATSRRERAQPQQDSGNVGASKGCHRRIAGSPGCGRFAARRLWALLQRLPSTGRRAASCLGRAARR